MRHLLAIPIILFAGCACEPEQIPVPTPVPVETVRYVPIPPELLRCTTDEDEPETNGELLLSWKARGDRLAECARSIEAVRHLDP